MLNTVTVRCVLVSYEVLPQSLVLITSILLQKCKHSVLSLEMERVVALVMTPYVRHSFIKAPLYWWFSVIILQTCWRQLVEIHLVVNQVVEILLFI